MNYEYMKEFISRVPTYKFAKQMGVHPSTIFRIKQGRKISPKLVIKMLELRPEGFEIEKFLGESK
ncbi:hypothetical protein Calkr_2179 [Caldicellulosiruptor acetigenus I77R1B]|uniref:HTH cro/C1-type domain-containing protein n=1 Tax=Caldicellulosiruptor acetigenus (strain ATCC 700853 / DSM 12137 / I77R1B) TaxID=632335 RepID=E4S684_CALA7|nr:helix-turn-helix transcriptional regulator [Caldicellulosiruptor acetigenus]ADQ41642.1 hypothetical protein Calkr_2179 [Caldicellulosiruptor acetigenus I77R1B]WAM36527.1 helix-turn-helix transcriptional regulator [Caldicellulosiruptor acetigenus]